jgi:organic radical activating enzyme
MSSTTAASQDIQIKARKSTKEEKDTKKCEDPMNVKIISVVVAGGDPKLTSRELAEILKLMADNKTDSS